MICTFLRPRIRCSLGFTLRPVNFLFGSRTHSPIIRRPFHLTGILFKFVQFKLSDIGEGIKEVVIKEWYVKVGDTVRQFDPICEVQSDKATVTISSRYDGIIRAVHFALQDTCQVGQSLVDIDVDEGNIEADTSTRSSLASDGDRTRGADDTPLELEAKPTQLSEAESFSVLATPSVRRMAMENNIKLSDVQGTGKAGRVLKEDILSYLNKQSSAAITSVPSQSTPFVYPRPPLTSEDKTVPLTVFQKSMKATMTASNRIPHFVLSEELDLTKLVDFRTEVCDMVRDRYHTKLTYMPFFLKATSLSLFEYPILNAHTDDNCDNVFYKAAHNISVAMDTPEGLLVPTVKSVQHLSIVQIAVELNRLQDLGSRGKLTSEDLNGGTITLSNIGSIAGTYTSPCILPPQVLIAGIGRIQRIPRFDANDSVCVGHILNVSWAADHRIIDGATVARFCKLWKHYLENPLNMLLHLQ